MPSSINATTTLSQSPLSNPSSWTDDDELKLMRAVAEIAAEPVSSFDPTVSPFARIEKTLAKPFTCPEILAKVKDLRRRFEEGDGGPHDEEVFEISRKVWGKVKEKKKKKKKGKKRKKKTKKRDISTLLRVTSKLTEKGKRQSEENESPLQKHFLAIISSISQKASLSSSSSSHLCAKLPGRLTEHMDLMILTRSSSIVSRALTEANQIYQEQNQGEVVDITNQQQITLISVANQVLAQSYVADSPVRADETHDQALLAESSCRIAENRFRMALKACTEGEGPAWASSAFSLCSDTVRPQNVQVQTTAEPFEELGFDTECLKSSSSPEYDLKFKTSPNYVPSPMDIIDIC